MSESGRWLSRTMWEFRRRHVYRATGAYAISAWFVVQIADVVLPALFAPEWVISVVVVLAILGLPVAALLAWVYDITPEGVVRTPTTDGAAVIAERPFQWTGRWVDYVIICGLLGILGWLLIGGDSSGPTGSQAPPSIAVLPFADLSPDQDSVYFSDGMAEAIMDSLARIPHLQVISRTSSFAHRNSDTDVRELAHTLGVDNLLEGSVRRSGNQVRISARLVDGRSGLNLWNQSYDAMLDDVFAVQDSISRAIAQVLEVQLTGNFAVEPATRDPLAYDLYLRGRALLRQEPTRADTDRAIEQFRLALDRDPAFGLAQAALCTAHWQQYETTREQRHVERALATCERARLQDPMRAETQIALGRIYLGTGRHSESLAALESALDLDPDNSQAHLGMGLVQEQLGQRELAEQAFRRAIQLDPAWWRNYSYLGGFYMEIGDFAAAAEQFSQAIRLEPDSVRSYSNLGGALLYQGEFNRAAEAFQQAIKRQPSPAAFANAGTSYFLEGRFQEAEVMFRTAAELVPEEFRARAFLAAAVRLQTGREAEARQHDARTIELTRRRLEVNPADDEARATLIQALTEYGRIEEAAEERTKLGSVDQLGALTHRSMALASLALGDETAALAHFEAAAELGLPRILLSRDPRLARLLGAQNGQNLATPNQHD
ncbi:MAG: tetratricopeptide repeat protein [Wenzhouxiangella sp.]